MGARKFRDSKHIVIASRECGDIQFLDSRRVPRNNIIACDIDSEARARAASWGVQVSKHPTIQDTVFEYGSGSVGSINIDLCCTLQTAKDILKRIFNEDTWVGSSWIAVTYCRAHDGMSAKNDPEVRDRFLHSITGEVPFWSENYNSRAFGKVGTSPMSTVLYRPYD